MCRRQDKVVVDFVPRLTAHTAWVLGDSLADSVRLADSSLMNLLRRRNVFSHVDALSAFIEDVSILFEDGTLRHKRDRTVSKNADDAW